MVSTPHIENQSNINGRKHELDLSPFLYNRRLRAFQEAKVDVPFQKLDRIPKREQFKFTTKNDGVDIVVRPGGK